MMDSEKQKFGTGNIVVDGPRQPYPGNLTNSERFRYNSEEERLKTFTTWPSAAAVDPSRLAKSGFFYSGKDDEVVCFSCNGRVKYWQYGDIVQRKHMDTFPHCDFVNNRSSNIPLISSKTTDEKTFRRFSEPMVNGLISTPNGIQKQISVADSLLSGTSKYTNFYLPSVPRNISEIKSHAGPSLGLNLEALFQEMKSEEKRLKTFKNGWPVPFIEVQELASAGFFYLGTGDKVQCPFCGGVVSNWESGDRPLEEHRRHFPSCTFLSTLSNRKLNGNTSWFKGKGYDICGHSEEHGSSYPRSENKLLDKTQEHTKLEDLGVSLHKGPAHPHQATMSSRLRSFVSWPSNAPVKMEDLASAGFFYIGISDHTKCFHCDGGLCSWESGDDPWVEHARWFRNCSFVRLNKGDDFIKMCIAKFSVNETQESERNGEVSSNGESMAASDGDIISKTESAMSSSLIQAVLETGLFAPYLVRAAVMRQLKETGSSFTSVDDICEAVAYLQQEMEMHPPKQLEVADTNLSSLNIELQPEVVTEDSEVMMEVSETTEIVNGDEEPETSGGLKKPVLPQENGEEACNGTLEEENRFLKDQRLCKVCMDNEVGVVFLPCGHLLSCTLCAPALKICPMCRKSIQATVRAYLP